MNDIDYASNIKANGEIGGISGDMITIYFYVILFFLVWGGILINSLENNNRRIYSSVKI
tara:strand:- start:54 stop:230 length:177 start_codon:yes stop_codon:yes gene_type:complete